VQMMYFPQYFAGVLDPGHRVPGASSGTYDHRRAQNPNAGPLPQHSADNPRSLLARTNEKTSHLFVSHRMKTVDMGPPSSPGRAARPL
jgi:hypothetical protein